MKFIIHYREDSIVLEHNNLEGLRELVNKECLIKRGWHEDDCWSEEVKNEN